MEKYVRKAAEREMQSEIRAALFSGLLWPGLGQYLNGQRRKTLVIMTGFGILALVLAGRIFGLVYQQLFGAVGSNSLVLIPASSVLAEIHHRAYAENWWLVVLLAGVWLYSIIDAYWVARRRRGRGGG